MNARRILLAEECPVQVHLRIPGAGIDYEIGMPRVPCVGGVIGGSDGTGPWVVGVVECQYEDGFAFAPTFVYFVGREP